MKHNLKYPATRVLLFLLPVLLLGCHQHNSKKNEEPKAIAGSTNSNKADPGAYKVIRIKDGDTFVLLMDGKEQVVRLAHIDCPEKKQPFANIAKQLAADLCFGKYVTLIHHNKYDRDRRLIAEIILPDGSNVNRELVKNGLAWHFKRYSSDAVYAQLEMEARNNKAGLWSGPDPVVPWKWRKH